LEPPVNPGRFKPSLPNVLVKLILAQYPVPVFDQIKKQIENLGFDSAGSAVSSEFVKSRIQFAFPKEIGHGFHRSAADSAPSILSSVHNTTTLADLKIQIYHNIA
jgi:hypothetical protein